MNEAETERRLRRYLPVVEVQLQTPATFAVKVMWERLVSAGYDPRMAKLMVAFVLASHSERSKAEGRPLDFNAYIAELASLTEPQWND